MCFADAVGRPLFSPDDSFRWRMGVRSLVADDWLQPDDQRASDLEEKHRLTERHPGQTFVAAPGSEVAAGEVLDQVHRALRVHDLQLGPTRTHPLETAGLSVQEDLCLIEAIAGQWRLTAGSVCFPTRWDLTASLGRTIAEIHAPVPDFQQIEASVDRFLDRMAPGALALRFNWSLVGDDARRLAPRTRQAPSELPGDPGSGLFVRIERQTLSRLLDHHAVVFGIRVHVWPLAEVVHELPATGLARVLATMPEPVARYKDLEGMRPGLVDWLRASARSSGG